MEVHWVCDMVVDRLHWMFCEQMRLRKVCQNINAQYGWIELHGKKEFISEQLPKVSNLVYCSLAAEEFDPLVLVRFATSLIDVPTLSFYADLITALYHAPAILWLGKVSQEAQDLCIDAVTAPCDLTAMPREEFCSRFHRHSANESCYATAPEYTASYFIHKLYATSSRGELLTHSSHVPSRVSLASIMYKVSSATTTLEAAKSSPNMLETEKMVMEMEMRLEEAKASLHKARAANHQAKHGAIQEAKNLAEQLINPFEVVRN
jgi:hypothetical protein